MRELPMATADPPTMRTITEQVADALRRRIRQERLQPGDRLGCEQELALWYGVSRPTMREAIRMVSQGGMLRSTKGPGGGTFVQRGAVNMLRYSLAQRLAAMLVVEAVSLPELLAAQAALELPVARLAAQRMDDATVAQLRGSLTELSKRGDWLEANTCLHQTIARAAANPVLEASVGWAVEMLRPQMHGSVSCHVVDQRHAALVDALARGDGDAAVEAMRSHLARVTRTAGGAALSASRSGRAALQLQAYIQREGFVPGDRLGREDELAATLAISRVVLREAVQSLAASHLIRVTRGRGGGVFLANTFQNGIGHMVSDSVSDLLDQGLVTLDQLFEARIAIEPALAGAAALVATGEDLVALREAIPDHTRFHRVLATIAPNGVVTAIVSWMFDAQEPRFLRWQGSEADVDLAVSQHRAIYAAIAAADAPRAEAAMREHLQLLADDDSRPASGAQPAWARESYSTTDSDPAGRR